uniref:Immunoglobulin V-set domain-containing protein n=1 Tax=Panthera leo TaxID=9689 RepID=A0A8C8X5X8_PANLE
AMSLNLFCVTLGLLGAGPVVAAITQTPRHHIIQTGTRMILECTQDENHFAMHRYRQDPGQGLKLIHYSSGTGSSVKGGKKEHFSLTLEAAGTNQTSLYLCASSESTALHGQLLSAQKVQPEA